MATYSITVIVSSPSQGGSSRLLASKFMEGAEAAGHSISMFDAALEPVAPYQGAAKEPFDAFALVKSRLINSDVIVFATPIYYFDMNAQMKLVIDRLHGIDKDDLFGKRIVLITTSHSGIEAVEPCIAVFDKMCEWFTWKKIGSLHATGLSTRADCEATDYPQQAYDLGANL